MQTFQPTLPARGATLRNNLAYTSNSISTHAPRTGSDWHRRGRATDSHHISTHAPRTGSDGAGHADGQVLLISTHAPRTGSDPRTMPRPACCRYFNPRSPHGERPVCPLPPPIRRRFQPTLPARGATRREAKSAAAGEAISTHAPRTGSDVVRGGGCVPSADFNPRSPHGERQHRIRKQTEAKQFQPTLPARGATCAGSAKGGRREYFNPRSPHGERRAELKETSGDGHFNPRSPHGERRTTRRSLPTWSRFQPTLPARGATYGTALELSKTVISTHAPRTGSDDSKSFASRVWNDFNPRSPHGERRDGEYAVGGKLIFQPTLPARGATAQSNNSVDQNHRLCTKSIP